MKTVIIEDEPASAERIKKMIQELAPNAVIERIIETVEEGISWLSCHPDIELIIADIELSDGSSFDLFQKVPEIRCHIIFTTAYHEYAIKAFEVNAIDYLLKPIDREKLRAALQKFEQVRGKPEIYLNNIQSLFQQLKTGEPLYRTRFLVKHREAYLTILTQEIRYFLIQDQLAFIVTNEAKKFLIEYTLNELEPMVPPDTFFRINRQMIISIHAIKLIHPYFNSRLLLELEPPCKEEVIVSREKVTNFKKWIEEN